MIDIVDRLSFDATRCEVQFSKGVASNIEEGITEIKRLRSILGAAMTKLDTMNVCCRETACERASDETMQDSSCDLRIVRGLLAAYQQEPPAKLNPITGTTAKIGGGCQGDFDE
jgi:hypothetical protein